VIPSDQVKQTVGQQRRQLGRQRRAVLSSLAARGRNTDDHVAEKAHRRGRKRPFRLRECEDISWAILPAIQFVQHLYLIVVRQQDGQLMVSHLNGAQHRARSAHQFAARHALVMSLNHEPHAHDQPPTLA